MKRFNKILLALPLCLMMIGCGKKTTNKNNVTTNNDSNVTTNSNKTTQNNTTDDTPTKQKYKVDAIGNVAGNLNFNHSFKYGEYLEEDTEVSFYFANTTTSDIFLSLIVNDNIEEVKRIVPGDTPDGFYNVKVKGTTIFKYENVSECKFIYQETDGITIKAYDCTDENNIVEIEDLGSITKYNKFKFEVENNSESAIWLIYNHNAVTTYKYIDAGVKFTSGEYLLQSGVVLTSKLKGDCAINVEIEDGIDISQTGKLTFKILYKELDGNELEITDSIKLPKGEEVSIYLKDNYDYNVYTTVIYSSGSRGCVVHPNEEYTFKGVVVKYDITVKVTKSLE